jgi:hypothetical protein
MIEALTRATRRNITEDGILQEYSCTTDVGELVEMQRYS